VEKGLIQMAGFRAFSQYDDEVCAWKTGRHKLGMALNGEKRLYSSSALCRTLPIWQEDSYNLNTSIHSEKILLSLSRDVKALLASRCWHGITHRKTGKIVRVTSKQHMFSLCGLPYQAPEHRP